MPTIHVVCPKCKKKLETSSQNEGRQGVCPECEASFDLRTVNLAAGETNAEAPEYADTVVVCLALALVVVLVGLAVTTLGAWSHAIGQARAYLAGQKAAVLAASVACAGLVLLAWKGRKSLAPAALVSTAWALAATIWVGGSIVLLRKANVPAGVQSAAQGGIYLTLLLACVAFALAAYLCFQLRDRRVFPRLPLFAAAALLVGLVGGGGAVVWHVYPALAEVHTIEEAPGEDEDDDERESAPPALHDRPAVVLGQSECPISA